MSDEDREPIEDPTNDTAPAGAGADTAEDTSPGAGSDGTTTPRAGEAWDDVLAKVSDLSDAISRWAKTAANDPENRRKLDEVKAGMDDMARQAQTTFEHIDETEFGKQVRQGAEETGRVLGDAAQKVSDVAAPHVAVIFSGLADAAGVDEQVRRTSARSPEADAAPSAADKSAAAGPSATDARAGDAPSTGAGEPKAD